MNTLFIINEGPYGDERPYNALRLALNLAKREGMRSARVPDGGRCTVCDCQTNHAGWLLQH